MRIQWLRQATTRTIMARIAIAMTTSQKLIGSSLDSGTMTFMPSNPAISEPGNKSEQEIIELNLPFSLARDKALAHFEHRYVTHVLAQHGGNVTRAASIADVSRQVIHKLIAKHRLSG